MEHLIRIYIVERQLHSRQILILLRCYIFELLYNVTNEDLVDLVAWTSHHRGLAHDKVIRPITPHRPWVVNLKPNDLKVLESVRVLMQITKTEPDWTLQH